MRNIKYFATLLMASTALAPISAIAQSSTKDNASTSGNSSVEDRLERLEKLVAAMQSRIDSAPPTTEDAQVVSELKQAISETRNVAQRQDALEEQVALQVAGKDKEKTASKGFQVGDTTVSLGGYIKLDATTTRTSGGQFANNSAARDFLLPSTIPVGGIASGFDTDFSARQTRFNIRTTTPVGDKKIGTFLELDFLLTPGGDERVSNSFVPRVRQAIVTFDKFTVGQTWSNFQNVGVLPDTLDFVGVFPGTVFNRQPLIKYSNNGFSFSAEQPETTVTTPTGGRIEPGDDSLPDFVARYEKNGISVAGIVRTLKITNDDFGTGSDTALGYGISIAGKLPLGKSSDIRFMGTAGEGLGRYIGANIVNDAAINLATGELDPIATYNGFAAFRHLWNPKWRSSIGGSYFKADNPVDLTGTGVTDQVWNSFVNLIYTPYPKLDVGLEYAYADRETEAGISGNFQRFEFSVRYDF